MAMEFALDFQILSASCQNHNEAIKKAMENHLKIYLKVSHQGKQ